MQNAAFDAAGLEDWTYVARDVAPAELEAAVREVEFANVTAPYKRDVARLFRVQRQRLAFVNSTKTAAPRAGIAEDQKRCGLIAPAFANIRTACLLANRVEVFLPQDTLQTEIVRVSRWFDFDPIWMSSRHGALWRSFEFQVSSFELNR